jgi:hypothetical protein
MPLDAVTAKEFTIAGTEPRRNFSPPAATTVGTGWYEGRHGR